MTDEFEKTINLKEKMAAIAGRQRERKEKNQATAAARKNRAEEIDHIYGNAEKDDNGEINKIKKPIEKKINEVFVRRLVFVLAVVIVSLASYFLYFKKGEEKVQFGQGSPWYAIRLVNEEVYYGQVEDTKSDPIVVRNVYYNYDQAEEAGEATSLRLVKRGKETHGPEGTMDIVRSQVLYFEPLKKDSKVLEAILDYER